MTDKKRKETEKKLARIFGNIQAYIKRWPSILFLDGEGRPVSFSDSEKVEIRVIIDNWEYFGVVTPDHFAAHWKDVILKPYRDYCLWLAEEILNE